MFFLGHRKMYFFAFNCYRCLARVVFWRYLHICRHVFDSKREYTRWHIYSMISHSHSVIVLVIPPLTRNYLHFTVIFLSEIFTIVQKFFLRCLKTGRGLMFLCPKNSNCDITKETRSHCQRCRYQRCIELAMYKPGTSWHCLEFVVSVLHACARSSFERFRDHVGVRNCTASEISFYHLIGRMTSSH